MVVISFMCPQVVHKLSQMILDHKFSGILDQGRGHLIVYASVEGDSNFARGVDIIANMGLAVETLFSRAKGLAKTSVGASTTATSTAVVAPAAAAH